MWKRKSEGYGGVGVDADTGAGQVCKNDWGKQI